MENVKSILLSLNEVTKNIQENWRRKCVETKQFYLVFLFVHICTYSREENENQPNVMNLVHGTFYCPYYIKEASLRHWQSGLNA